MIVISSAVIAWQICTRPRLSQKEKFRVGKGLRSFKAVVLKNSRALNLRSDAMLQPSELCHGKQHYKGLSHLSGVPTNERSDALSFLAKQVAAFEKPQPPKDPALQPDVIKAQILYGFELFVDDWRGCGRRFLDSITNIFSFEPFPDPSLFEGVWV